jgi:hypothetical protein
MLELDYTNLIPRLAPTKHSLEVLRLIPVADNDSYWTTVDSWTDNSGSIPSLVAFTKLRVLSLPLGALPKGREVALSSILPNQLEVLELYCNRGNYLGETVGHTLRDLARNRLPNMRQIDIRLEHSPMTEVDQFQALYGQPTYLEKLLQQGIELRVMREGKDCVLMWMKENEQRSKALE